MRKIIFMLVIPMLSCEKIDNAIAQKYCWECQQVSTAGVGENQTIRTVSTSSHCDLTVTQMQDLENKAKYYLKESNGSWSRISMICNKK